MHNLSTICKYYLSICLKNKKLSKHTLKAYQIDLNQFELCFEVNTSISCIDKNSIRLFQNSLSSKDLSASSIKRKLACVRAMFRWLELEEIIELNPFHKFKTELRLPKILPRNVPTGDLQRIIKASRSLIGIEPLGKFSKTALIKAFITRKSLNGLTTVIAIELLLSTGIRVGELTSISLNCIDLINRKIKIIGKGSRERYVFIPDDDLVQLIEAYLSIRLIAEPSSHNFLVNSRGQPASTQFIRKIIKCISIQANTGMFITPHMLRHSAACELIDSGLDIRFVQKLLGHSSIMTTELYTHVSDRLLQKKISQANVRSRVMKK